jgi:hypothetical protein
MELKAGVAINVFDLEIYIKIYSCKGKAFIEYNSPFIFLRFYLISTDSNG